MASFPSLETKWVLDTSRNPPVYTRPMIGSELSMQKHWNTFDAQVYSLCHHPIAITPLDGHSDGEVCIGVDFTCSIDVDSLRARARTALDKLRFVCPIIACTVEDVTSPRWVYTPSADRDAWLDLALAVEDRGESLDASAFLQGISFKRLPYTDGKDTTSLFRAYLLTTSKMADDGRREYGLYFHGSHTFIDASPGLHALNLMCAWMSGGGMDVRIEPSEEWQNLPVDPVTATGGLSRAWETSGQGLLQEFMEQNARTTPCHALTASHPLNMSDPPFRYTTIISEAETAAIVAASKQLGVSVSALFHAAHCLAQFTIDPLPETAGAEVDFASITPVVALERYFKPPVDPRTHFISSFTMMPMRFSMTRPLSEPNEKARLISTAKMFHERFDTYLAHPCLPQALAMLESLSPVKASEDEKPPVFPWYCAFNNLGVIEAKLQARHGEIIVENVRLGNRMRNFMTAHMWNLHSKFCFQIQGNMAWGEDCIKAVLEETIRIAFLVLDE